MGYAAFYVVFVFYAFFGTPIKDVDRETKTDERKRKYNSMQSVTEPTEAEIEAYKRTRVNQADPMAQFLSK